jgi:hypothetical protein
VASSAVLKTGPKTQSNIYRGAWHMHMRLHSLYSSRHNSAGVVADLIARSSAHTAQRRDTGPH